MKLYFDVRPGALLGTATIEGDINEEINFDASVAERDHLMNKGAFGTKVLSFNIEGIATYGQHEGWIQEPSAENAEFVRAFVSKLASSIRTIKVRTR
jgi:hypothetical protein